MNCFLATHELANAAGWVVFLGCVVVFWMIAFNRPQI